MDMRQGVGHIRKAAGFVRFEAILSGIDHDDTSVLSERVHEYPVNDFPGRVLGVPYSYIDT